ncbi:uncharacterized protein LOC132639708 [Lycium barbarum]|uniref:uncharacterized protein LOC132639708 n=1 Tax=Lycium barbarum TaxID=112863 RepID=UPI00293E85EB|nr:uncharacterized protein LOC132639708 [Lycium barbarum]
MKLALRGKGELGFINDTCIKRKYKGDMEELWDKCDAIVLSWIGSTVSSELIPSIMYASSAKQIREEFQERFDKSNLTRIYHLFSEIFNLKQVNEAYAIIVQEESKRSLGVVDVHREPLTMLADNTQGYRYNKPVQGPACGECVGDIGESSGSHHKGGGLFTPQQYQEVLNKLGESSPTNYVTNMIGISSILSNAVTYKWIVDSGASHHITHYKELLTTLRSLGTHQSNKVQIPNGDKSHIAHAGNATILGLFNGKVMGIGRERDGLHILQDSDPINVPTTSSSLVTNNTDGHLWLKFPVSDSKTNACFQLVHLDLWGPYKNSTYDKKQLFVTMQNGTVESKHKHILEVARALRFQSAIFICFWGDCVRTAIYLINKFPSPVLGGKSPCEMLFGKISKLDHLRVFGCLCYASKLPRGDKFAERARKVVLVGYSEIQKGYRLYDLVSKVLFISRDVTFRELVFPFKHDVDNLKVEDMFLHSVPDSSKEPDITCSPQMDMQHEIHLKISPLLSFNPLMSHP